MSVPVRWLSPAVLRRYCRFSARLVSYTATNDFRQPLTWSRIPLAQRWRPSWFRAELPRVAEGGWLPLIESGAMIYPMALHRRLCVRVTLLRLVMMGIVLAALLPAEARAQ